MVVKTSNPDTLRSTLDRLEKLVEQLYEETRREYEEALERVRVRKIIREEAENKGIRTPLPLEKLNGLEQKDLEKLFDSFVAYLSDKSYLKEFKKEG